jgi:hypothetical protein
MRWRRLDVPGNDVCRLTESVGGWTLAGAADFNEEGVHAQLEYSLDCDRAWRTLRGQVQGRLGERPVAFSIARAGGAWTLNGAPVPGLEHCVDLDLGFTPATNLTQLRRIALAEGQAADVPVAWLDVARGTLTLLPQRYARRSADTYWYESPTAPYAGLLEVSAAGFVRRYPGLWEEEV